MRVQTLALHPIDEVGQAVRVAVQIRVIDLEDVAREHELGAVAGTGDDGLHLVRGEVLRLVDDEVDVDQAASPDVRERRNHQLLLVEHLADALVARVGHPPLVLDDAQVVVERLHVGIELRLDVAGQVPDVLVGQRHHRAGHVDLAILLLVLECRGESEQGLAGARLPRDADELDLRVRQRIQGEGLLGVARGDAVGGQFVHPAQHGLFAVVGGERRLLAVAQDQVLVRHQRLVEGQLGGRHRKGVRVHPIHQRLGHTLLEPDAGIERRDVLDVIVAVVLRHQAEGLGLHAQVDVLAHEDDLPAPVLPGEPIGDVQDLVVRRARLEGQAEVVVVLTAHLDDDVAEVLANLDPGVKQGLLGQAVECAQELARLEVDGFVTLLETVELLEHRDGNDDVVLLELVHALAVVKDDVGVEHEHLRLPSNCHRGGGSFRCFSS